MTSSRLGEWGILLSVSFSRVLFVFYFFFLFLSGLFSFVLFVVSFSQKNCLWIILTLSFVGFRVFLENFLIKLQKNTLSSFNWFNLI